MITAALFRIAKTWNNLSVQTDEKRKMCYICTMEYYSAVKKEILLFMTTWLVDLVSILRRWNQLDRKRQMPYDPTYMESKNKIRKPSSQIENKFVVVREGFWGGWVKGIKGVIGTNFQLKINKSWDVVYSMVTVVSNTTMNEIRLFAVTRLDLEIVKLSEVSQTEKHKLSHDITYIWNLKRWRIWIYLQNRNRLTDTVKKVYGY